jgi:hypothetical protein
VVAVAAGAFWMTPLGARAGATAVSISGTKFLINGKVTHPGTAAEGLLLNSRMVQAIFDDENSNTVGKWKYPDTGKWDPERNVKEFIAELPTYAARGLRAVTISLQGGRPASGDQVWHVSAFRSDGTLKSAWLSRLDRVIRAADANGVVVIVSYFYFGQDERLSNETAVLRATDGITDWLVSKAYSNVLVEVNNETGSNYDHAILKPSRVSELIARVKQRSGGKLKVSTSTWGGQIPNDSIISASDYILLHGNSQDAAGIRSMVDTVRGKSSYKAKPKPIVFNEDSTKLANMDAAVSRGASWGYYDGGKNDYWNGFQSPPVNWTLSTFAKLNFFDRVKTLTASTAPAPAPTAPTSSAPVVASFTLINADTDAPISGYTQIAAGSTIDLATLPTKNLNIRANTSPSIVGSVRFGLNGTSNYRIESAAPYALAGDDKGDYEKWTPSVGSYTVSGTAYTESDAKGTAGSTLTVGFTVVNGGTAPAPEPAPAPDPGDSLGGDRSEWFVAPGKNGDGSSSAPFGRIQDALNAAGPGDAVIIRPGTYAEAVRTVRHGSASTPITIRAEQGRGSVTVTIAGTVLAINHGHHRVEGLQVDAQYASSRAMVVGNFATGLVVKNTEVRRSTKDCVQIGATADVTFDGALIHRCLNAANGRTDAHGIVGGALRNLTIRNTEIHTFSGDAIQLDPGRSAPGWDRVTIERSRFWLAPLDKPENGFAAGVVPGENALDTKTYPGAARASVVIRDTMAWGFRHGLLSNMAAFNLKENIDATIDRVTVSHSEIAFRVRGPSNSIGVGAHATIQNAVVHSVDTAVRYEDDVENLLVWNSTLGTGVSRPFRNASSPNGQPDVRNLLVLGSSLPAEAPTSRNRAVSSSSFLNAAGHDYRLAADSPAINAGVTLTSVTEDRIGVNRPVGGVYDVGAYEYAGSTATTPLPDDTSGSTSEVVLYASEAPTISGAWTIVTDSSAAGGARLRHPDAGLAGFGKPRTDPVHYFELTFNAEAGKPYRLWIRGKADDDFRGNDSVHVQFSGSVDASGAPIYRIGTQSSTEVILEECYKCGVQGWGWTDNGWEAPGPLIRFAKTGQQRILIQTMEDGFSIDQVVLSAAQYLNAAPGPARQDNTILPR